MDKKHVLAKAVLRAASELHIDHPKLISILGLNKEVVFNLNDYSQLLPSSKQEEVALLLIQLSNSLTILTGGDSNSIYHFMNTPNLITKGTPIEQIENKDELINVLNFVTALKSK